MADGGTHAETTRSCGFMRAEKRIADSSELHAFWRSRAYAELLGFIASLTDSVKGTSLSESVHCSDAINALVAMLSELENLIEHAPPHSQQQRFGNTAYRDWFALARSNAARMLSEKVLSLSPNANTKGFVEGATEEISPYLLDGFGNATRIDYGTGHETHFACFLLCLTKLGVLNESDFPAVVNRVFRQYLRLVRRLQVTYWLEPAGSHGVWGLDDHQFLPFIFGASQLIGSTVLRPKSALSSEMIEYYASEYLFFGCVLFASQIKKGPLQETSPVLCDICRLSSWQRVCSNLYTMYKGEVLGKFPIMQHFLFGSLLTMDAASEGGASSKTQNAQRQQQQSSNDTSENDKEQQRLYHHHDHHGHRQEQVSDGEGNK